MSIESIFIIAIFVFIEGALICSLVTNGHRPAGKAWRKRKAPEDPQPFDPCGSCQRWGECNGVDRPNCPLWWDHDNEEARHGKEKEKRN